MKIGIMSDSHGNIEYVRQAAEYMMEAEVEYIIHLGDDYYDARILDILPVNVIKVPGVYEAVYQDASVPNRLVENIAGLRMLITHTKDSHRNDLPHDKMPEEFIVSGKVGIVLFGHSHSFCAKLEGEILMVNPGHLKTEDKRGEATFALLDINKDVTVTILNMKQEVKLEASFQL